MWTPEEMDFDSVRSPNLSPFDSILVTAEMLMMQPMCTGHPYSRRDRATIQKATRILEETL